MTFHFGYCEDVLFEAWKVRSVGSLIGSMIGIMILAALYEGLKYYRCAIKCFISNFVLIQELIFCCREYLFWKSNNSIQYRSVTSPEKAGQAEEAKVVQWVALINCLLLHCLGHFWGSVSYRQYWGWYKYWGFNVLGSVGLFRVNTRWCEFVF